MTLVEVAIAGVFGLMVGSFLNVVIARLPAGESIVTPASRCPRCGTPIGWLDNVPVLSYALVLRGRCRACAAPISLRYPIVEIVTGLAFAAQAAIEPEPGVGLAARLVFTSLLIALAGIDLETFRLPNPLTLGGLAAGLVFSVWLPPGSVDALIGVVLGAGILLAIRTAWLAATGTDAMGLGDVKMLAMIGAFLGWQQVLLTLMLATIAGATVGLAVTFSGRGDMRTRLPFGVFLSLGAFVSSLIGPELIRWYVGLLMP